MTAGSASARSAPDALRRQRTRRVLAPWRWAFGLYAVLLTTSTHWPQLVLGPAVPASDKFIHFMAFATGALLLSMTRWIPRLSLLGATAVGWAALDEYSQGIPGLYRHVSFQDGLANALGAFSMVMWIWALSAVGEQTNRGRLRRHEYCFEEIFARWRTWLLGAAVVIACVAPMVLLWPHLTPTGTRGPVLIAATVLVLSITALIGNLLLQQAATVQQERPCFECDASCAALPHGADGVGVCTNCGARTHIAQWSQPPAPPGRLRRKLWTLPAVFGVAILLLLIVGVLLTGPLYSAAIASRPTGSLLPRAARFIGQLPADTAFVVDLSLYLFILAIVVRIYRHRLARLYDHPERCRGCGHDLRGTPVRDARGRCGECGMEFTIPEAAGP